MGQIERVKNISSIFIRADPLGPFNPRSKSLNFNHPLPQVVLTRCMNSLCNNLFVCGRDHFPHLCF